MASKVRLRTPDDVRRLLAKVVNRTLDGQMDTKTANTITLACNAILNSIRTDEQQQKLLELQSYWEERERENH